MFNSITIENFQSHEETELELSEGVNVIVGVSDSGKSAIIRALKWLKDNRPAGDEFCSDWGGGATRITVRPQESEADVSRARSGADNVYVINCNDPLVFKAIRSEVPEEIQQALKLDNTNLQMQYDSHFLLAGSAGEAARHFNAIANLDAIDRGTKNVQRNIRKIQSEIDSTKGHIDRQKEALAKYDYLEQVETAVTSLEQLEAQRLQLSQESVRLANLLKSIQKVESDIAPQAKVASLTGPVEQALELIKKRRNLENNRKLLDGIMKGIYETEDMLAGSEAMAGLADSIEEALTLYKKQRRLHVVHSTLDLLLQEIIQVSRDKERALNNYSILEQKFHDKFPDVCPLCGQEVKK